MPADVKHKKIRSITFKEKLFFTKNMAVMLHNGIPIMEATQLLSTQLASPNFRTLVKQVMADIDNGEQLSTALSVYPNLFSALYINLVKIGEKTGTLQKNFEHLSAQLLADHKFRQKIQGILLYPIIIFTVALIAAAGISIFVLPQLSQLFTSLDIQLPLSTRILLAFADIMQNYGIEIIPGLILLFIGFRFLVATPQVRPHWQKFLLSLPVVGTFLQNVEIAGLCLNWSVMLKSGLPISASLDIQKESTTNAVFKKIVEDINQGLNHGHSVEETLIDLHSPYVPLLFIRMVGIGEKSGQLDETLEYLSTFYAEEVDTAAQNFATLLEPIALLCVGGVVAFLAFSIISPIYQFTSGIHR